MLCIKVAKSTMCNRSLGLGLQRCHNYKIAVSCVQRMEVIVKMENQSRTNGPINAHLTIAQVMPRYNHNNEKQEALL